MTGLLQLISLITSFAGFVVTAAIVLINGEMLWDATLRALLAFGVMWAVLTVLCAVAEPATHSETFRSDQDARHEVDEAR